jgi:hypothetical protein
VCVGVIAALQCVQRIRPLSGAGVLARASLPRRLALVVRNRVRPVPGRAFDDRLVLARVALPLCTAARVEPVWRAPRQSRPSLTNCRRPAVGTNLKLRDFLHSIQLVGNGDRRAGLRERRSSHGRQEMLSAGLPQARS